MKCPSLHDPPDAVCFESLGLISQNIRLSTERLLYRTRYLEYKSKYILMQKLVLASLAQDLQPALAWTLHQIEAWICILSNQQCWHLYSQLQ